MNKWISVEEGLPKTSFATNRDPINNMYIVRIQKVVGGVFDGFTYEVCECLLTMANSHYFNIKTPGIVTHWMKLPEFKENENEF